MTNRSEEIVSNALDFIMKQFKYQLKIAQLCKQIPQYNVHGLECLTFEIAYSDNMPQPQSRQPFIEDLIAPNIPLDINATFMLQSVVLDKQQPHEPLLPQSQVNEMSRTKKRQKSIKEERQPDKGVFQLSEVVQEPDIKLEEEITEVKRSLYFKRKIRKDYDDEEKKRYDDIINRKHLELPNQDFSYDFTGEFLFKMKTNFKKNLAVLTSGKSEDIIQANNKVNKVIDDETSQRDFLVSRGQGGSREGKRILFGNAGKRQISNLPFIKLGENIRLSENNRNSNGPDTSRYTLKSYQSRGDSSFKHYSQLEKERTERLYSLKRSSKITEFTEDDVEDKPATHNEIRRQSKRMQKYLKKLCEDKSKQFVVELNKSSNFHRVNSPHDYSIHRYYKHNFDQDKKSICDSSLVSLRLNMSHLKE